MSYSASRKNCSRDGRFLDNDDLLEAIRDWRHSSAAAENSALTFLIRSPARPIASPPTCCAH